MSLTREYEITYIVDPSLDENKRGELNAAIDSKIDAVKGVINRNSESLRRKLAYPVSKQRVGFLRLIQAQLEPQHITSLRHEVKRLPGVLRLNIIQCAPREDVTSAIFDTLKQPPTEAKVATAAPKKSTRTMTDEEVTEKIEEALDEEVK